MKKLFMIANWKSDKTTGDAAAWLKEIKKAPIPDFAQIIVCPPFILLSDMQKFIKANNLPVKLGVQNISPFGPGAYTGEVNAKQAHEFVTYAIVGHSERRKYFGETDDQVIQKVERLLEYDITPVLCVSDMKQMDYYLLHGKIIVERADKIIFVYEPPGAISGGGAYHQVPIEDANTNAGEISKKIGKKVITIYGGSMNPQNSTQLCAQENIQGGLIGKASLDALSFFQLIPSN
jgi:triosephosphate isomerase